MGFDQMRNKSALSQSSEVRENLQAYLEERGINLSTRERHKIESLGRENVTSTMSFLGWFFVKFKKLLQEPSLLKGLRSCLQPESNWEEEIEYAAFAEDFRFFDRLSNHYANKYRGSFTFNYLMGAAAVLMALIPVGFSFEHNMREEDAHAWGLIMAGLELAVIMSVMLIYQIGATPAHDRLPRKFFWIPINRRWHEKWFEYRALAERFRYMEILYPLGLNPLEDGLARRKEFADWTDAYYSMRVEKVKTQPITDWSGFRNKLRQLMQGQSKYHHKNALSSEHIHHRLHKIATWMFYGTMIACVMHFMVHSPLLTLIAGFFPAVAASMHGILANGEFSKSSEVSERMHLGIEALVKRLDKGIDSTEVIKDVAIDFHNLVINEALQWKTIFKDKNVPLA